MNRILMIVAMAALVALAGCQMGPAGGTLIATSPPPPQPGVGLPFPVAPSTRPDGDGIDPIVSQVSFQVFCDVVVVDVPGGSLSGNGELWGHLREDALGVRWSDHLAKNGFRVGVGKAADFNEVSRLLVEARDRKARSLRLRFDSESAMEIVLNGQMRELRPFVFAMDGAVSGDEYPAGATFYWMQAWHDIEHIDTVKLTLVPEIRYGKVKEKYFVPTLERTEQYRDVGRIFNEVKLDLRLTRNEFLVLSPRPKGGPALALGRVLLADDSNKAQPREMVMLIRPRVVRTPVPR